MNRLRLIALSFALLFSTLLSAQETTPTPLPAQEMTEVQRPILTGSDPKPENATSAILAAFDKYEVVGMGAAHGNKDLDDFILDLVRNPALPGKINDIVVECGNSLYQTILDRYIAGEDVPLDEARQVWRNTTQPMCGVSAFYEELFPLVRRINQKLPPEKKLRMLAGDPPIDWSKVKSRDDFNMPFMMRNVTTAAVMEKQTLARHRKALMLFGIAHLYHHGSVAMAPKSAVERYEQNYPGVTLVIADHTGFGNWSPLAKFNNEFESRMAPWPIPSLVQNMTGTSLADLLDKTHSSGNMGVLIKPGMDGKPVESRLNPGDVTNGFSKMVDAYLYLGPRDLLLKEPRPAEIFLNKDYMAELQHRAAIMGGGPVTDQANPDKISDRDFNPFLYDPDEYRMMMGPGPFFQPRK